MDSKVRTPFSQTSSRTLLLVVLAVGSPSLLMGVRARRFEEGIGARCLYFIQILAWQSDSVFQVYWPEFFLEFFRVQGGIQLQLISLMVKLSDRVGCRQYPPSTNARGAGKYLLL